MVGPLFCMARWVSRCRRELVDARPNAADLAPKHDDSEANLAKFDPNPVEVDAASSRSTKIGRPLPEALVNPHQARPESSRKFGRHRPRPIWCRARGQIGPTLTPNVFDDGPNCAASDPDAGQLRWSQLTNLGRCRRKRWPQLDQRRPASPEVARTPPPDGYQPSERSRSAHNDDGEAGGDMLCICNKMPDKGSLE